MIFDPVVIVLIHILALHVHGIAPDLRTVCLRINFIDINRVAIQHAIGIVFNVNISVVISGISLRVALDFVVDDVHLVIAVTLPVEVIIKPIEAQEPCVTISCD